MNKQYLTLMIMALLCINLNVNAQQDLQNFINEFKSSIELPEYYNGKQLMARTPYEVRNMYIKNGVLFFQYTTGNQSYTSNYSVEIDLNKVEIKKGTDFNYSAWFAGPGSIVVRKTGNEPETILVDWFTFACKSEGMRERIYKELTSIQIPFKTQTTLYTKKSPKRPLNKDSKTSPKKSKSGKYAQ